ncbi:MAG: ABC transporter ATP-binding protein [Chloroflexi bacterium]|nr:ABC transporter ATP-binding protein [Chloroflexota bacterium]
MVKVALDNVSKSYGKVRALHETTLELEPGALTAILGPSGCGKTTLLRSIAGFIKVDSGRICFDGRDVTGLPPQERDTAMVFQNYALWPHMTVFDNVAYGLKLKKVPASEVRRRVMGALELVEMVDILGVEGIESRKPPELSGGQQQRVALARALVVQPKVLLLDEPLSNLDAKVRQRVRVEIRRLQKRVRITTIHVTHDQEEALSIADSVVVMDKGKVIQVGSPQEIYRRPQSAFVAEFLGSSNVLTGQLCRADQTVSVGGIKLSCATAAEGKATVVFRADEARLAGEEAQVQGNVVVFQGEVEETLFVGSAFRHFVKIGTELVMVDSPESSPFRRVKVVVPREKVQIYPLEG